MKAQQLLQGKMDNIRSSITMIEIKLKKAKETSWGEDYMFMKQQLEEEHEHAVTKLRDLEEKLEELRKSKGITFSVENNGVIQEMHVVPEGIVSPREGLISANSPLAKAVMVSETGQVIELSTPKGVNQYILRSKG